MARRRLTVDRAFDGTYGFAGVLWRVCAMVRPRDTHEIARNCHVYLAVVLRDDATRGRSPHCDVTSRLLHAAPRADGAAPRLGGAADAAARVTHARDALWLWCLALR